MEPKCCFSEIYSHGSACAINQIHAPPHHFSTPVWTKVHNNSWTSIDSRNIANTFSCQTRKNIVFSFTFPKLVSFRFVSVNYQIECQKKENASLPRTDKQTIQSKIIHTNNDNTDFKNYKFKQILVYRMKKKWRWDLIDKIVWYIYSTTSALALKTKCEM